MSMSSRLVSLLLGFCSAAQAGTILLSPVPADKLKLDAKDAAAAVGQPRFLCNPSAYVAGDRASGADAKACGKQRQIGEAPQEIAVVYWVPLQADACPSKPGVAVEFVEVPRRTVLGAQIKTLVDALRDKLGVDKAAADTKSALAGNKNKAPPSWQWCEYEMKYTLQHLRATLTLNARLPDEVDKPVQDTATLITGPEENWFLSGDGILRGTDQVKWDADKKTLVSTEKPEQLYIGINYTFGDIYGAQKLGDWPGAS